MRFKRARKARANEILEIDDILRVQGLSRQERRQWIKTLKKEALLPLRSAEDYERDEEYGQV